MINRITLYLEWSMVVVPNSRVKL